MNVSSVVSIANVPTAQLAGDAFLYSMQTEFSGAAGSGEYLKQFVVCHHKPCYEESLKLKPDRNHTFHLFPGFVK